MGPALIKRAARKCLLNRPINRSARINKAPPVSVNIFISQVAVLPFAQSLWLSGIPRKTGKLSERVYPLSFSEESEREADQSFAFSRGSLFSRSLVRLRNGPSGGKQETRIPLHASTSSMQPLVSLLLPCKTPFLHIT